MTAHVVILINGRNRSNARVLLASDKGEEVMRKREVDIVEEQDITGKRFGRWLVIKKDISKKLYWGRLS